MKSLYEFLIVKILAWLHGLTAEQFEVAKRYVLEAERSLTATSEKWLFVKGAMQTLYPKLRASAINLVIELAVAWVVRSQK